MRNWTIIEAPIQHSLYSVEKAGAWLEVMQQMLAASESTGRGVILFARGNWNDSAWRFIDELEQRALRHAIKQRIRELAEVYANIRRSKVPWIFFGGGDLLGGGLELALACHHRLWLQTNASVGFPGLSRRFFPPALVAACGTDGNLQLILQYFREAPVRQVGDLQKRGWIDYCLSLANVEESDLFMLASKTADQALRLNMASMDSAAVAPRKKLWRWSKPTAKVAERLDRRRFRQGVEDDFSALVQAVLVAPDEGPVQIREFVLDIGAEMMISQSFSKSLARSLTSRHLGPATVGRLPSGISVVCGPILPPKAQVLALLQRGLKICFVGAEPYELATALGVIRSRLQDSLGVDAAESAWDRQVSWQLQRGGGWRRPLVVEWTGLDGITLTLKSGRSVSFLRLAGNRSDDPNGMVEVRADAIEACREDDPTALDFVRSLHAVTVETVLPMSHRRLAMASILRFQFFSEMCCIAENESLSMDQVWNALETAGWGRVAESEWWTAWFDQQQPDDWPLFSSSNLDIGYRDAKWDAAMRWANFEGQPTKSRRDVFTRLEGDRVSRRLLAWCAAVSTQLARKGMIAPPEMAESFVIQTLDAPGPLLSTVRRNGCAAFVQSVGPRFETSELDAVVSHIFGA